ncbi:class I SAM-dependent methyltransferase [bacterium]|nr:class I SAM-dependent methyltransferase [bacterium]
MIAHRPAGGIYADPVVYDILQSPGTAAEVDAFERIEARFLPPADPGDRLWYEPACGTGRYLRVARARGRRVGGYDLDPGMAAYASRRLGSPVRVASMTDPMPPGVRPGSVDFAFNPVNTIRLLDSDAAVLAHLAQIAWLLAPRGIYVVGISLTDFHRLEEEEDLWEGARGRCRVSQLVNYLPPEPGGPWARIETVISHLTITRPAGEEHRDDRYDLRCYDRRQWRRLLDRSRLKHLASCDASGEPFKRGLPNYQIEVLGLR